MAQVIDKLVVIGVGLIGGSFALALKRAHAVKRVAGIGRAGGSASLATALKLGVIDEIGAADGATLNDATLVMLAMPVGQMAATMHAIAPHLGDNTVVTDAGSTKLGVIAAARKELGRRLAQFVPAHPIAGAELSGPEAAKANLFDGRRVVIADLAETSPQAKSIVEAAWQACGAKTSRMSAESHDRVFAAVSHLPHLLAYALVHELCGRDNAEELFAFAASGFRDFTRIAGSDASMWRDIFLANRERLMAELDAYTAKLEHLRGLLATGDAAAIEQLLRQARDARNKWGREGAGSPPAA
jgi:prephenate dehydrogenase